VLQKVSDKPEERAEWGQFWIDKGFAGKEDIMAVYIFKDTPIPNITGTISVI
jgi:hypothetical protein